MEAASAGRKAIGSDINSLSIFIAKAKLMRLTAQERKHIDGWAREVISVMRCNSELPDVMLGYCPKNMDSSSICWNRKLLAGCIASLEAKLPDSRTRHFARCAILNAAQWAIDGRRHTLPVSVLRSKITEVCVAMLKGNQEFQDNLINSGHKIYRPILRQVDARALHKDRGITRQHPVDLVVTSPPYPGVHMLYHRWQIHGRRETDAPYWIAGCIDGSGEAHYNFASRGVEDLYFERAQQAFESIRAVMRKNALLVQMVAFSDTQTHLERYLHMLQSAGFAEIKMRRRHCRIWRQVPRRRWHANMQGDTAASREVVLLHSAN